MLAAVAAHKVLPALPKAEQDWVYTPYISVPSALTVFYNKDFLEVLKRNTQMLAICKTAVIGQWSDYCNRQWDCGNGFLKTEIEECST